MAREHSPAYTCRICGKPSITGVCYACAWNRAYAEADADGAPGEDSVTRHNRAGYGAWLLQSVDAHPEAEAEAHPDIAPGDGLRAIVEAELILTAHWNARHGCNCERHVGRVFTNGGGLC